MLRVGDEIGREDGRRYRLCGVDGAGRWIGQPLDRHGPPETLTAEMLREGFGVADAAAPSTADERTAWENLGRAFDEVNGRERAPEPRRAPLPADAPGPPPGSPEAVFLALEADDD